MNRFSVEKCLLRAQLGVRIGELGIENNSTATPSLSLESQRQAKHACLPVSVLSKYSVTGVQFG